jgi:hypothetical protein
VGPPSSQATDGGPHTRPGAEHSRDHTAAVAPGQGGALGGGHDPGGPAQVQRLTGRATQERGQQGHGRPQLGRSPPVTLAAGVALATGVVVAGGVLHLKAVGDLATGAMMAVGAGGLAADQDPGHGPVAGQPPAPRGRQRPGPASLPTHHFRPLPTRPSSHGLGRSLCHATAWLVGRHGAAWPRHRAKAGTSGLYRRPWPRRVTSGRTHPQTGVGPMGEPRARWVHGARGRAPSQARGKGPAGAPPCQLSAWAQLRPSCRASGWGPSATLPDDCLGPSSEHQARRLHRGPHEPRPTVPGNCMGAPNPHPPTQQANGPDPYRRWHPGQSVVPRPPRTTLRNGVAQRGQGRPAWP